jgi:putative sugar O-methyltransferase
MTKEEADTFVDICEEMLRYCRSDVEMGVYWDKEVSKMMAQLREFPLHKYPLTSSRHHNLSTFGCAAFQPDLAFEASFPHRSIRRLVQAIRRIFGYGKIAELIPGLHYCESLLHYSTYSRINYSNAVNAGYILYGDHIKKYNISSPDIFGEQVLRLPDGTFLAWETLMALKKAICIKRLLGEAEIFMEIGAGTGELARILLEMGVAQKYIIVDIPPALAVSQCLMTAAFNSKNIAGFSGQRMDIEDFHSRKCLFLLPSQTHLIEKADAGINTGSFQEMPRMVVSGYVSLAKRVGLKNFVSINTREPHTANLDQCIDEGFYTSNFEPEFEVSSKFAWDKTLELELKGHDDSYLGYQLLNYRRKTNN